jgi:hypothetical protein
MSVQLTPQEGKPNGIVMVASPSSLSPRAVPLVKMSTRL